MWNRQQGHDVQEVREGVETRGAERRVAPEGCEEWVWWDKHMLDCKWEKSHYNKNTWDTSIYLASNKVHI